MAARQGLRLDKSRRRDPRAIDYGGYMIIELSTDTVTAGGQPRPYSLNIDDVERYLTEG
jgi:hypothetical protein